MTPPANELRDDLRTGVPAPRPGAERARLLGPRWGALRSLLPHLAFSQAPEDTVRIQVESRKQDKKRGRRREQGEGQSERDDGSGRCGSGFGEVA